MTASISGSESMKKDFVLCPTVANQYPLVDFALKVVYVRTELDTPVEQSFLAYPIQNCRKWTYLLTAIYKSVKSKYIRLKLRKKFKIFLAKFKQAEDE